LNQIQKSSNYIFKFTRTITTIYIGRTKVIFQLQILHMFNYCGWNGVHIVLSII